MLYNFIFIGVFLNCCVLLYLTLSIYSLTKKINNLSYKVNKLESNKGKIKLFEKGEYRGN
jgi:cell division protein FtsL